VEQKKKRGRHEPPMMANQPMPPPLMGSIPRPPMPPFMFPPGMRPPRMPMVVPRVPYIPPINQSMGYGGQASYRPRLPRDASFGDQASTSTFQRPSAPIHYPSQDPQHLGAKDLAD